jgi:hypothetical protein
MEALRGAVKEMLTRKKYYHDNNGSLRRAEPKPFAELPGRQRKKARKAARRDAKARELATI